jgi:hypothetical protein
MLGIIEPLPLEVELLAEAGSLALSVREDLDQLRLGGTVHKLVYRKHGISGIHRAEHPFLLLRALAQLVPKVCP